MTFMAVDMAGGVFCILSLVFKESIDILATVSPAHPWCLDDADGVGQINYAAVVLLDGIVIILALILNPRARRRERERDGNLEGREDTMQSEVTTVEGTEKVAARVETKSDPV